MSGYQFNFNFTEYDIKHVAITQKSFWFVVFWFGLFPTSTTESTTFNEQVLKKQQQ